MPQLLSPLDGTAQLLVGVRLDDAEDVGRDLLQRYLPRGARQPDVE